MIKEGEWKSLEEQQEKMFMRNMEKLRRKPQNSTTSVPNKELVETLAETNKVIRELLKQYEYKSRGCP